MWLVAKTSVVGQAHVNVGLPCQDYCGELTHGSRRIIALADGAGSAKFAERGSQVAVEVILRECGQFSGPLATIGADQASRWLEAVRAAISEEATKLGADSGDFATTLLFAILDGQEAYFWQLGDGAWVVDAAETVQAATWPYTGQYVNETVFVTSETAADRWVHAHYTSVTSAMGFSDGLELLFLDLAAHGPHLPIMGKIFTYLRSKPSGADVEQQLGLLLASPLVCERSDDDKTIAVAWRSAGNANR